MIELTERIGAEPVYRVMPAEMAAPPKPGDKKSKKEAEKNAKTHPPKKIVLGDEDDKGEKFDETV